MKKLATIFSAFGILFSNSQTPCDNGRFADDVFDNVTVTPDIVYGQNASWTGANTTLRFDFYEPQGDAMAARPLLIWVHGGSFLGGSRTEADMVALSTRFAKKGFACASIGYRTGFFPIDSTNSVRAVVRAVQDLKGAIRYFYKDAATDNDYKIDTTNIYIGGSSAGAITALHVAYLTEECELYDYLNATQQDALGGLEGDSGSAGYSSQVKGVLNGCGALARYSWMDISEINIPIASVHGTSDNVVTYNRGLVNPGVPLMYLDGSRMIHERACAIDLENQLYTFNGAGHVPYLGNSATAQSYMDTTVNFYRDFLIKQLGCTQNALQPTNEWAQTATLYALEYCDGSPVNELCATSSLEQTSLSDFTLYPNPISSGAGNEKITIDVAQESSFSVVILDLSGRVVHQNTFSQSSADIDVSHLHSGTYLVKVIGQNEGKVATKKLVIQ